MVVNPRTQRRRTRPPASAWLVAGTAGLGFFTQATVAASQGNLWETAALSLTAVFVALMAAAAEKNKPSIGE